MISPKSWLLSAPIIWSQGTQSAVFLHLKQEWRMGPQGEGSHKTRRQRRLTTDPKCLRESKMFIRMSTKHQSYFLGKPDNLPLSNDESLSLVRRMRRKQISTPEKKWVSLVTDAAGWVLGECASWPWGAQKDYYALGHNPKGKGEHSLDLGLFRGGRA